MTSRGRAKPRHPVTARYPRMARVNELLREVLAEAIELEAGSDLRLELATVTAVDCDPDLRHATVLMSSLSGPASEALAAVRPRLQAAVARQVRMKRTPQLRFAADPAIAYAQKVESVLAELRASGGFGEQDEADGGAETQVPFGVPDKPAGQPEGAPSSPTGQGGDAGVPSGAESTGSVAKEPEQP